MLLLLVILAIIALFVVWHFFMRDHEILNINQAISTLERVLDRQVTYEMLKGLKKRNNIKLLPSSFEERELLAQLDPDMKELYFDPLTRRVVRRPLCQVEREVIAQYESVSGSSSLLS